MDYKELKTLFRELVEGLPQEKLAIIGRMITLWEDNKYEETQEEHVIGEVLADALRETRNEN